MNSPLKPIQVFKHNPPLKVINNRRNEDRSGLESDSFIFAIPKLNRQIAHARVIRYFQNSGNIGQTSLDSPPSHLLTELSRDS